MTQAERITALEVQVTDLRVDVQVMSKKIDDLLALRNKGAGVFWFASVLFGTTLLGLVTMVIGWIKH